MKNEELQTEKNQNDTTKNIVNPLEQNGWNDIGDLDREVWRDVVGYEGLYQVSNIGRVRGLERFDSWGRIIKSCMLVICNGPHNYGLVSLANNGKRISKKVHRLVAEAFIPNPENKPQVNHKDGKRKNNHVENLEWCTARENAIHALNTGLSNMKRFIGHTHAKHEKNGRAKINMEIANSIRKDYEAGGTTIMALSKKYGISKSQIIRIVKYQHWN